MIKIGPLIASDFKQAAMLLQLQAEVVQEVQDVHESELALNGLAFWQHWLPPQMHLAPSVYVAKEDGLLLGIISLQHTSKSKSCWQVDKLVVHPEHRGRGIAQELLRYVFALFGSQGVMHFLAEVPATNDAALTLFANCGFCRSSRITYYRFNPAEAEKYQGKSVDNGFKLALPHMKAPLFQLYCEFLPPALRQVLLLAPADFPVKDLVSFTSVEKSKQKLMRKRIWYWIAEDTDRMVFSSASKVLANPEFGYKLEFAVHPGWKHMEEPVLQYTMTKLLNEAPRAPIWAKLFDFQGEMHELMVNAGFERTGEAFLLLREHWQRSRKPGRAAPLQIGNPVITFPLAADRNLRR